MRLFSFRSVIAVAGLAVLTAILCAQATPPQPARPVFVDGQAQDQTNTLG
jgi:hypothetical protein